MESFNGRFRDECPNEHLLNSLAAAKRIIEAWRIDYNTTLPQTSLDGLTQRHSQFALKRGIRGADSAYKRGCKQGKVTHRRKWPTPLSLSCHAAFVTAAIAPLNRFI